MTKYITKATGEKEPFKVEKFERSLRKAGADQKLIKELTKLILKQPNLDTTKKIYSYAYLQLKKSHPPIAARYNLKTAIAKLGPSGFPFEHFVAEIFRAQKYTAKMDQTLQGKCVTHEIDIVLEKGNRHFMVECKFHKSHLKSDVKAPLYIKSRFDDIVQGLTSDQHEIHQAWVVTNTKFTSVAEQYGVCAGMHLVSWSFPKDGNLAQLVDSLGLHPITALTTLNARQKRALISQGLVLCRDAQQNMKALQSIGLGARDIEKLIQESKTMCELGAIK